MGKIMGSLLMGRLLEVICSWDENTPSYLTVWHWLSMDA